MILEIAELGTPIGTLVLVVRDGRVCALEFGERWPRRRRLLERRFGGLELRATTDPAGVASRLARYFEGDVRALDDIPVDVTGTPFQRKVWTALREIAPGAVASYQQIARRIGAPTAVRAVGAANGANPVAIVVPCHRVIGADGQLTGYAGGLDRKRWLLAHEGARGVKARRTAA